MTAAPTTAPGTEEAKIEDQTDDRKEAEEMSEMVDILTQRGDKAIAQAIEKLYQKLDSFSEEDIEKLTAKMAAIKELNG